MPFTDLLTELKNNKKSPQHFEVSNESLSERDIWRLVFALPPSTSVTSLTLKNVNLNEKKLKILSQAIKHSHGSSDVKVNLPKTVIHKLTSAPFIRENKERVETKNLTYITNFNGFINFLKQQRKLYDELFYGLQEFVIEELTKTNTIFKYVRSFFMNTLQRQLFFIYEAERINEPFTFRNSDIQVLEFDQKGIVYLPELSFVLNNEKTKSESKQRLREVLEIYLNNMNNRPLFICLHVHENHFTTLAVQKNSRGGAEFRYIDSLHDFNPQVAADFDSELKNVLKETMREVFGDEISEIRIPYIKQQYSPKISRACHHYDECGMHNIFTVLYLMKSSKGLKAEMNLMNNEIKILASSQNGGLDPETAFELAAHYRELISVLSNQPKESKTIKDIKSADEEKNESKRSSEISTTTQEKKTELKEKAYFIKDTSPAFDSLPSKQGIRSLNVKNNNLDLTSIKVLASLPLTYLNVANNPLIDMECIKEIKKCVTLTELDISENKLDKKVIKLLSKNKNLRKIILPSNLHTLSNVQMIMNNLRKEYKELHSNSGDYFFFRLCHESFISVSNKSIEQIETICQSIAKGWAINYHKSYNQYRALFWIRTFHLTEERYPKIKDKNYTLIDIIRREFFCFDQFDFSNELLNEYLQESSILWLLESHNSNIIDFVPEHLHDAIHSIFKEPYYLIVTKSNNENLLRDKETENFLYYNDKKQKDNYINDLLVGKSVEEKNQITTSINNFLNKNPDIEKFIQLPFYLNYLEQLYNVYIDEFFSNEKITVGELQQRIIKYILQKHAGAKKATDIELKTIYQEELTLLEQLAIDCMEKNSIIINNLLLNDDNVVRLVQIGFLRSTLLFEGQAKSTGSEASYQFTTFALQEHFAASYLIKVLSSDNCQQIFNFININKFNPRYKRMLAFTAGLLNIQKKNIPSKNFDLFWQTLQTVPHSTIGQYYIRLLMSCLHESRVDASIPKRQTMLELIDQYLIFLFNEPKKFHSILSEFKSHSFVASHCNSSQEKLLTDLRSRNIDLIRNASQILQLTGLIGNQEELSDQILSLALNCRRVVRFEAPITHDAESQNQLTATNTIQDFFAYNIDLIQAIDLLLKLLPKIGLSISTALQQQILNRLQNQTDRNIILATLNCLCYLGQQNIFTFSQVSEPLITLIARMAFDTELSDVIRRCAQEIISICGGNQSEIVINQITSTLRTAHSEQALRVLSKMKNISAQLAGSIPSLVFNHCLNACSSEIIRGVEHTQVTRYSTLFCSDHFHTFIQDSLQTALQSDSTRIKALNFLAELCFIHPHIKLQSNLKNEIINLAINQTYENLFLILGKLSFRSINILPNNLSTTINGILQQDEISRIRYVINTMRYLNLNSETISQENRDRLIRFASNHQDQIIQICSIEILARMNTKDNERELSRIILENLETSTQNQLRIINCFRRLGSHGTIAIIPDILNRLFQLILNNNTNGEVRSLAIDLLRDFISNLELTKMPQQMINVVLSELRSEDEQQIINMLSHLTSMVFLTRQKQISNQLIFTLLDYYSNATILNDLQIIFYRLYPLELDFETIKGLFNSFNNGDTTKRIAILKILPFINISYINSNLTSFINIIINILDSDENTSTFKNAVLEFFRFNGSIAVIKPITLDFINRQIRQERPIDIVVTLFNLIEVRNLQFTIIESLILKLFSAAINFLYKEDILLLLDRLYEKYSFTTIPPVLIHALNSTELSDQELCLAVLVRININKNILTFDYFEKFVSFIDNQSVEVSKMAIAILNKFNWEKIDFTQITNDLLHLIINHDISLENTSLSHFTNAYLQTGYSNWIILINNIATSRGSEIIILDDEIIIYEDEAIGIIELSKDNKTRKDNLIIGLNDFTNQHRMNFSPFIQEAKEEAKITTRALKSSSIRFFSLPSPSSMPAPAGSRQTSVTNVERTVEDFRGGKVSYSPNTTRGLGL